MTSKPSLQSGAPAAVRHGNERVTNGYEHDNNDWRLCYHGNQVSRDLINGTIRNMTKLLEEQESEISSRRKTKREETRTRLPQLVNRIKLGNWIAILILFQYHPRIHVSFLVIAATARKFKRSHPQKASERSTRRSQNHSS